MSYCSMWTLFYSRLSLVLLSVQCLRAYSTLEADILTAAFGQFDSTETTKLFDVKITKEPVSEQALNSRKDHELYVIVHSKYGQRYSCSIPLEKTTQLEQENVVGNLDEVIGSIYSLLQPLKTKCYFKNEGWWTYKYCHGDEVTQFHLEAGKVVGDTILLGVYERDQAWEDVDILTLLRQQPELDPHKSVERGQHHVYYSNGTVCDLSGKQRHTTAKFVCHHSLLSNTQIIDILEIKTCVYMITIHSPQLCGHPAFKPFSSLTPSIITCIPVLTEKHYQEFLEQVTADEALRQLKKDKIEGEKDNVDDDIPVADVLSIKPDTQEVPLSVVLNSLANSVVEKMHKRKTQTKAGSEEEEKKENNDQEGQSDFEAEEVDAMIDEMVKETLENVLGLTMPPVSTGEQETKDDQFSAERDDSSQSGQGVSNGEAVPKGETVPNGEATNLASSDSVTDNAQWKIKVYELKSNQREPEEDATDIEHKRSGLVEEFTNGEASSDSTELKVTEMEGTDNIEAVTKLTGILSSLIEMQDNMPTSSLAQKERQKQDNLEDNYNFSWEKQHKRKSNK